MGMPVTVEHRVFENSQALAAAAAEAIVRAAVEAVGARGRFTIALAGGSTPRQTFERLAGQPWSEAMPWDRTLVFFGDERCVPPEHPESNYRMAQETLLGKVAIPPTNVVAMRCDDNPEAAAAAYAARLAEIFGTRRGERPRFDLILLGMGLDGHTASLFPGSPALKEVTRTVIAVHASAAAVPQRVTLTLPVLNAAAAVIILVAGAEKAKAVKAVLADGAPLPAGMVRPVDGRLVWMLDRPAAALLGVENP